MNPQTQIKVRIYTYKSFRHYGGREIQTIAHVCNAAFIAKQDDNTFLVALSEDCAHYKAGYKIAIQPKDFNI